MSHQWSTGQLRLLLIVPSLSKLFYVLWYGIAIIYEVPWNSHPVYDTFESPEKWLKWDQQGVGGWGWVWIDVIFFSFLKKQHWVCSQCYTANHCLVSLIIHLLFSNECSYVLSKDRKIFNKINSFKFALKPHLFQVMCYLHDTISVHILYVFTFI